MSDVHRLSLAPAWRASIIELFPTVTPAQLLRLDDLIVSDRFVLDGGEPHPCLIAWVGTVLNRGEDGEPAMAAPGPAPKPMPSGAEVWT